MQFSVEFRPNHKLAARYYVPYMVIKKVGQVAYTLQLPPDSKVHPTLHVSQLKKHYGKPPPPLTTPFLRSHLIILLNTL